MYNVGLGLGLIVKQNTRTIYEEYIIALVIIFYLRNLYVVHQARKDVWVKYGPEQWRKRVNKH